MSHKRKRPTLPEYEDSLYVHGETGPIAASYWDIGGRTLRLFANSMDDLQGTMTLDGVPLGGFNVKPIKSLDKNRRNASYHHEFD